MIRKLHFNEMLKDLSLVQLMLSTEQPLLSLFCYFYMDQPGFCVKNESLEDVLVRACCSI